MKSLKAQRYIIGITGPFGSGKSTAASFFESHGYKKVYLSSYLEQEAEKRGLKLTRKILQDIGNELREKFGNGYLMKKALNDLKGEEKVVIDGIRNLGELYEIKRHSGSIVLGIVANREIRLKRLQGLKRRESLTKSLFNSLDSRDLGIGEKMTGLQGAFCLALADVFIDSNGGLENFKKKLNIFLKEYER